MNREDILNKSRAENKSGDEREHQVNAKAGNIAFRLGGALCMMIVFLENILSEEWVGRFAAFSIYTLMLAFSELYIGIALKSKWRIAFGVFSALLFVVFFTGFILMCAGVIPK